MPIPQIVQTVVEGLPIILIGETVVAVVIWFLTAGRGDWRARVAAWIALVTATLWIGSIAAFILLHAVLFVAGREAALVGVLVTTVVMVAMPFGWAYVVGRRSRRADGSGA